MDTIMLVSGTQGNDFICVCIANRSPQSLVSIYYHTELHLFFFLMMRIFEISFSSFQIYNISVMNYSHHIVYDIPMT